ncbi:Lipolytic enzyme [Sulfitobacter noctilucicola]|uniref:Pimeloyl-ACP methyl ester carboxylesterase n=1 Tax=Sulfitobacter noctilucicola TaxID=1342301 RepID=A0A7W6Q1Y9_9RHOB|nr:alpha/beta hydrolase [Sulfitobacter noctilucicola]KIN62920.1 Lipolytic enzyme [Sulfitobacter noctilucicola]MBB4172550.1 pimeloyl-ACP methyl ester carboxylesterase [Sulfitobacter noctilucicola]
MPELKLSDITLHYEVDGSGPPVLLLAGMLSDNATWLPLVPLLSERFTVIRPDNRTTGRTEPKDAAADCALMAEDAMALMAHLGHEKFHVAGHSLGGLLSLEIAHTVPDRVATATVLASGRVRSPRTASLFSTLLAIRGAPEGEEMWLRAFYPWVFGNQFFEEPARIEEALIAARAYPHAQSFDAMKRQVAAFHAFRPKAKMAEITCPALVLYAGQDLMIPPDLARPSFAPIPDLTEATIEHAGHSIVWDAPTEVAAHLTSFLDANAL